MSHLHVRLVVSILGSQAATAAQADVRVDLLGHWGGGVHAVEFDGKYAYVGVGPRLVIVDLSEPAHPRRLGQTDPLGFVVGAIAVNGPIAYVGLVHGGLRVIDVSDRTNPVWIGTHEWPDQVWDVAASGNLVITSSNDYGIHIFDVTTPQTPILLSRLDNPDAAGFEAIGIFGEYAYAFEDGLRVLDLADPAHPITLGHDANIGTYDLCLTEVDGSLLGYMANWNQIQVIDLTDPWGPFVAEPVATFDDTCYGIDVEGAHAYATGYYDGLRIYDIASPYELSLRATVPTRAHSTEVAVQNGIACVSEWYYGLEIVDVTDSANPAIASHYDEANHSLYVSAADGLAFVSGYRPGVQVLDVSDPSNARRVAEWEGLFTFRVRVRDTLAVVADAAGLKTMDISNLQSPRLLATLTMDEVPVDFVLDGAFAYIANHNAGLTIVDLSDPSSPREIASLNTGLALGLAKRGDSIYLAMYDQGLQIVDVTKPSQPVLLGSVVTPGLAYSVAVLNETAFVASLGGINVVDVSDLFAPRFVTRLPGESQWQTIEAEGDRVFVAAYPGLRVLDASNPLEPRLFGRYADQGWTQGLAYADGLVFLATDSGGLEILAVRPPGDLDGDGAVGIFDLAALLSNFGTCTGDVTYNRYADLDSDECVTVQDLAGVLAAFGR